WEQIAAFWDEKQGEDGNASHRLMIAPAVVRLLNPQAGERILDAACGNGVFSRRLAALGVEVVGFDFSAAMVANARRYAATHPHAARMTFHEMDATNEAQLLTLGAGSFDAVACLMAFMDMPEIAPLCRAVRQLLKPGGRFVFSILHPSFNSAPGISRLIEEEDRAGTIVTTHAFKITQYLTPSTSHGLGIVGQPVPQYYFHRPLHLVLQTCFEAGFVLDGLEEPATPPRENAPALSLANFPEFPPFLVARLRISA
ncbi:MAG: class I SAM-dependent methyltransferase, partial [Anaerolineales bacterium]|nr:class I SAM-dependent methyltransferase [Anaerolineales bacterium]